MFLIVHTNSDETAIFSMDIMSMKSSRRKQSKPLRVSYNDEKEKPLQAQVVGDEEFATISTLDTCDLKHEKENKHDESLSSAEHSNECDTKYESSSPINLTIRDSTFPTAYHRLASEFTMKNVDIPNGHKNSAMDGGNIINKNDNNGLADGEHGDKNNGEKPKDHTGVFHLDVYCELCDKEFCNKYFLKTHKANKHGIYDTSISPFLPCVNPLPPSMILPQDYSSLPLKLNIDCPMPPLKANASSTTPSTPQPTPTNLPTSSPQRKSPPALQPLNQMPNMQPLSPMPFSVPKPLDSYSNSTLLSQGGDVKSSSGQDMEDFCKICQKHFCNKYYLKKHKNDVHGITLPDTPVYTGKQVGQLPNSEMKLSATPVTTDSLFIPHSLANLPGLENMPGLMVINPFLPPMLIPGSLINQHGYMPPRLPHMPLASPLTYSSSLSLPVTSINDSKSVSSGSSNTSATSFLPSDFLSIEALHNLGISIPDSISPGETLCRMGLISPDGQITSDVLRGIGILGGETFCDICRKEFCNVYFLKIHKANKHGIYIDEPSLSPTMAAVMNLGLPTKPSDLTTNTLDNMSHFTNKEPIRDTFDSNKPDSIPKTASTVSQPSDFMTHCNMCSQEFASKYAYRIHRIQAHGMVNEPFNEAKLAEEAFKLHSGELPKHVSAKIAEEISDMGRNSEAAGFSTMFGSIVATKLADRVTCEICNKELCNKYFLKIHKMKVHGIDIAAQERSLKPGAAMLPLEHSHSKVDFSPSSGSHLDFSCFSRVFNLKPELKESSQSCPASTASIDNQLNQSVERPSHGELTKMGMDLEAYCEICKKEFCSKYFLRTHKQNIHGIPPKTDSHENSASKSQSTMSMAPHLALSTPLLPSSFMSYTNRSSLFTQTKPMNLSSISNMSSTNNALSVRSKTTLSSQHSNNKWKEPQNSARVTCELCNKELCNKYFLRTHKINKHGILLEDLSPSTSQNMSPNTSDVETNSNSSVPADVSHEKRMQSPKVNIENLKRFTNKEADVSFSEVLNLKIKAENDRHFNSFDAEICYLCSRRFKNSKWLQHHILNDHAGMATLSPTMEKVLKFGGGNAPFKLRTCSTCSIVFPSEMLMQLHMIQEHNAQVTIKADAQSAQMKNFESTHHFSGISRRFGLKPRFTFSVKQKSYCCSVCSHKSKWLSKILSHERSVHGINHNMKKLRCNSCHKVFRKERSLRSHLMKVHGDYSVSEISFSKQYRCAKCYQSFSTALECHLHIRHDHIRRHSFHVNNHFEDTRHRCSKCHFSTRFKKQFQRHTWRCHNYPACLQQSARLSEMENSNSGRITYNLKNIHAKARNSSDHYMMQTFEIKQCSDDGVFLTSVIEMPVLQKLKGSASVAFIVTPLEEL